jgi:hypothetical protein
VRCSRAQTQIGSERDQDRERERPMAEGEKSEKRKIEKKTLLPFDSISRLRQSRANWGFREIVH